MIQAFKITGAAAVLAITGSMAVAAPANISPLADGLNSSVIQVHGNHRSCERDRRGWHRHNQWGERRPCRRWDGRGPRPNACVRVGPIFYCDY
jgi:hypothetical protein